MSESTPKFEEMIDELERVLRDLESGTTTLDDALARYERGVHLLRQCYGQLRNAEQRIQQLTSVTSDLQPVLQPFDHESSLEKQAPLRRQRPAADSNGN